MEQVKQVNLQDKGPVVKAIYQKAMDYCELLQCNTVTHPSLCPLASTLATIGYFLPVSDKVDGKR